MTRTHSTLLAVCLLAAGPLGAQEARLTGGFKAGLGLAKFTGDDARLGELSPGYRKGFAAGAFLTFSPTERFAVQPELLYVQKGTVYEQGDARAVSERARSGSGSRRRSRGRRRRCEAR